jgi:hypothetical protein
MYSNATFFGTQADNGLAGTPTSARIFDSLYTVHGPVIHEDTSRHNTRGALRERSEFSAP